MKDVKFYLCSTGYCDVKIFRLDDDFYVDVLDLYRMMKAKNPRECIRKFSKTATRIPYQLYEYKTIPIKKAYEVVQRSRCKNANEAKHWLDLFVIQIRQGLLRSGPGWIRYPADRLVPAEFYGVRLYFVWYNDQLWVKDRNLEQLFGRNYKKIMDEISPDSRQLACHKESSPDTLPHRLIKATELEHIAGRYKFRQHVKFAAEYSLRLPGIINLARDYSFKNASKPLQNLKFPLQNRQKPPQNA